MPRRFVLASRSIAVGPGQQWERGTRSDGGREHQRNFAGIHHFVDDSCLHRPFLLVDGCFVVVATQNKLVVH
jgi:hypothetical protein